MIRKNGQPEYLEPSLTLALMPAWQAGIKDSINPGAMSGALVFSVLLWLILNKGWPFKLTAVPFVLGVASVAVGSALGAFDLLASTKGMDLFHDVSYFVLASVAILLGLTLVRDWWAVKRSGDRGRTILKFSLRKKGKKPKRSFGESLGQGGALVAAFLSGGVVMGAVQTAWAPDVYSAQMIQSFFMAGGNFSAMMDFLFYGGGYIFPLFFLGMMTFAAAKMGSLNRMIEGHLTIVQIILAGILLSYGFTVVFRYYL